MEDLICCYGTNFAGKNPKFGGKITDDLFWLSSQRFWRSRSQQRLRTRTEEPTNGRPTPCLQPAWSFTRLLLGPAFQNPENILPTFNASNVRMLYWLCLGRLRVPIMFRLLIWFHPKRSIQNSSLCHQFGMHEQRECNQAVDDEIHHFDDKQFTVYY